MLFLNYAGASPDNRENLLQVVDQFGRTKKPLIAKISINVDKTALKPGFLFDFRRINGKVVHCRRVMCAWVAGL
jgi:hypothetical protein